MSRRDSGGQKLLFPLCGLIAAPVVFASPGSASETSKAETLVVFLMSGRTDLSKSSDGAYRYKVPFSAFGSRNEGANAWELTREDDCRYRLLIRQSAPAQADGEPLSEELRFDRARKIDFIKLDAGRELAMIAGPSVVCAADDSTRRRLPASRSVSFLAPFVGRDPARYEDDLRAAFATLKAEFCPSDGSGSGEQSK